MIQAKQTSTGKVFKTESVRTGDFTLSRLPAGSYELVAPITGFKFDSYSKKDIHVQAGRTVKNDIRLQWFDLGTLGDDQYLAIHNRNAALKLTGPVPRVADGKPDLSGVWNAANDVNPEEAQPLPWVGPIMEERAKNGFKDLPGGDCLPDIVPAAPLLYKIIQTPKLLIQLFEQDPHYRQIFIDGRPHPKDADPTWMGHSTGKWEGDTFVIDTVGFNDKGWLPNFMPHTEKLHVVERYRRVDFGHLNIDMTFDDPGTLVKPWRMHVVWELSPKEEILEYICTENNKFRESVGPKDSK
jgi:hypothetical protein